MNKVILVQPENGLNETVYVPLGLISLAAYIRNDFEVKIVDLRLEKLRNLYKIVENQQPLAVGFSMLTGSCIKQIIEAAKEIKKINPETKIIVGGIHPTFFPEQTIKNSALDFVVINEGEESLLELLKVLEANGNFSGILGLGWKNNEGKTIINGQRESFLDMNTLPMPAWDLIDVERYSHGLSRNPGEKVIDFYTSKGCPYPCAFCYNLNFNRRKWRAKSAEKAFGELEFLHNKYGINYFIIHDDNFVVDKERALKFAQLIIDKDLKIQYSVDSRVDYFEEEFFGKLKESGLCELRVGCESGSNRILKNVIQKGITVEQTLKAIEIAKKLDLKLILSFVIGWPTETIAERQQTIDLILKIQKIHPKAAIYPLWIYIPYPGTPLFKKAVEMGFNQPRSLEEWGNYFWGKAHIPWLKNPEEYELIHALSPFAWYNKKLLDLKNKSFKNIIRHFTIKFFRPLVLFRFKHNFWKFPLDAKLIVLLKKMAGK
jgi:radical SAM superfamily enzyme YgiQ (UPF0313 family)